MSRLKRSPIGVVWKLGVGVNSGEDASDFSPTITEGVNELQKMTMTLRMAGIGRSGCIESVPDNTRCRLFFGFIRAKAEAGGENRLCFISNCSNDT
ncbi:hypothetical protein TNCV_4249301 [Trichonephila clavipes]|nr:hypothetical protein TNCV_4249301 [Trichonephila clavipes]